MISSVYFSNVELKSTEILLTEEKPDYTTSQMLRFELEKKLFMYR